MTLQSDVDFWLPVVFVSTLLGPAAMFFSFRNQKVCSLRWRLTSPVCFGFHLPSRCLGIFMLSISFIWLAYWRSKAVASTTSHCRNKGPAKWKFYILFPWLHFIELAVRDKIFCWQARFAFRPLWRLRLRSIQLICSKLWSFSVAFCRIGGFFWFVSWLWLFLPLLLGNSLHVALSSVGIFWII